MLQNNTTDLKEKIDLLEKQYLLSSNEIKRLSQVLSEKMSEYETQTNKLRAFKKEFILTDKKYQVARNRIPFLQNRLPSLENELKHISSELLESEKEINSLKSQKEILEEKLSKNHNLREELSKALLEQEQENSRVLSEIISAENEKKLYLNEVSDMLSQSAQEHIKNEKELDEFSTEFIKVAGDREIIKVDFNKKRTQIDRLEEKKSQLESELALFTETVKLANDLKYLEVAVEELKTVAAKDGEDISILSDKLSENSSNLKELTSRNSEQQEYLLALEDAVKSYDELQLKAQASNAELIESKNLIKKALSHLTSLFNTQIEIKKRFYPKILL
ncbi:MAG: hypothetical protein HQK68_08030 [Desulfamplus sp.]|nr:hypothetical protein [Desulfamplus sp.]